MRRRGPLGLILLFSLGGLACNDGKDFQTPELQAVPQGVTQVLSPGTPRRLSAVEERDHKANLAKPPKETKAPPRPGELDKLLGRIAEERSDMARKDLIYSYVKKAQGLDDTPQAEALRKLEDLWRK